MRGSTVFIMTQAGGAGSLDDWRVRAGSRRREPSGLADRSAEGCEREGSTSVA